MTYTKQLKSLYHVALNCCDKLGRKPSITSFKQDVSEVRMRWLVGMVSKKNNYIKSYVESMNK